MLAPNEMTAEGGIDLTLLVLPNERLIELAIEEDQKLKANGIDWSQNIGIPVMEVLARVIAVEKVLVDNGLSTQDDLNRMIIAFKISHMRLVAEQILPQLRAAQARSKIITPGVVPPNGLPGIGGEVR